MKNFKFLVSKIQQAHESLQLSAVNAVNRHITVRNWLIGYYIFEFEQEGEDRAKYGNKLLEKLESRLQKLKLKNVTSPELSRFRTFYLTYPTILNQIPQEISSVASEEILGTLSQELAVAKTSSKILGTVSQELAIFKNLHVEKSSTVQVIPSHHLRDLFGCASFSHFAEIIKIDDTTKRLYYEMLIIKTSPSVRELRRAIDTMSYERTGLSKNKRATLQQIEQKIKPARIVDAVKDIYIFDFLGLPQTATVDEATLETALLNHLEKFILELGNGFCFEARQKRILIGDEYFFVDMVFYHRILHCHVLIELKVDRFSPAYASQLKTYLNFFDKNLRAKSDNPPIGILLVTDKNKALVEYAGASLSDKMFVSKYSIMLPSKRQLENFIRKELQKSIGKRKLLIKKKK